MLNGGAGNDMLDGKGGSDTFTGGAGNDTFVIGLDAKHDTITDFGNGNDAINLTAFQQAGYAPTIARVGNDTTISFGNGTTVTLIGVASSHISDSSGVVRYH